MSLIHIKDFTTHLLPEEKHRVMVYNLAYSAITIVLLPSFYNILFIHIKDFTKHLNQKEGTIYYKIK
ncbi:hypothetical protein D0X99_17975 [Algoriphagus lacus]|uniref:Uncharacterized protein n=1 Tax=Algoriphagus lacus TaxID=2056311 RepID=A0A418PMC1_9BACT|nr:hypothetical protein D0X99_17975 [Algoriphagus lacus]